MKQPDCVFKSLDGLYLRGYFFEPDKAYPVIILCHTKGTSSQLDIIQDIGSFLLKNRYNVFLFDFRGHGESQPAAISYGYYEKNDILGAVNYLIEKGFSNIGALGISFGAASLLFAAAESSGIKAIVSESAYACFEEVAKSEMGESFKILEAQKKELGIQGDIAPITVAGKIRQPVLVIAGDSDQEIPFSHSKRIYDNLSGPKDLWIIRGGGHFNCYKIAKEEYNLRILDFFNGSLKG